MSAGFDADRLAELLSLRATQGLAEDERAELAGLLAAAGRPETGPARRHPGAGGAGASSADDAGDPEDARFAAELAGALAARFGEEFDAEDLLERDLDRDLDLDAEGHAAAAAAAHLALAGELPLRMPAALRRDLEWCARSFLAGRTELRPGSAQPGPSQPGPSQPGPSRPEPATLERARPARERRPAAGPAPGRGPAGTGKPAGLRPWLAAAAVLLALSAVAWFARGGAGPAPSSAERRTELLARADTLRVEWSVTADPLAAGAAGDVVWNDAEQAGYLRIAGLPPNDPQRNQYQLWIFDARRPEATPVDGGVFDVPPGEEALIPIAAKLEVFEPTLFAVTLEPPGGVVVSTRERLLLAAGVPN